MVRRLGIWVLLAATVGAAAGVTSAGFLWLLDWATSWRETHGFVVWALPAGGFLIGGLYDLIGKKVRAGYALILDTLHDGGEHIQLRLLPMVLGGTVLTHLVGGSAGREGTAVQMGASLGDFFAARGKLDHAGRRALLVAGIAGGFGSVFGTPWAGAIFGIEVLTIGRLEVGALIPALVASLVGDQVTRHLGIIHTAYPTVAFLDVSAPLLGKWLLFALAVAVVGVVFVEAAHRLKAWLERVLPWGAARAALGGVALVGLWRLSGTDQYLGLGVPGIVASFSGGVPVWAFAWKLLFTVVTVGTGFIGGEVTPLFFIGASLGSTLAVPLGLPPGVCAAVGMAALFGAVANTPLALSIMAVELVGPGVLPHVLPVAVLAYLLCGNRGIYPGQRVSRKKHGGKRHHPPIPLRDLHRHGQSP